MRTVTEVQGFLKKESNRMKRKPTPQEQILKDRLDREGIRYQFQSIKFSKGTYRIFDFYLPKKRLVIEVDGPYHSSTYDKSRDQAIGREHPRLRILRFTNWAIENDIETCVETIKEACR